MATRTGIASGGMADGKTLTTEFEAGVMVVDRTVEPNRMQAYAILPKGPGGDWQFAPASGWSQPRTVDARRGVGVEKPGEPRWDVMDLPS